MIMRGRQDCEQPTPRRSVRQIPLEQLNDTTRHSIVSALFKGLHIVCTTEILRLDSLITGRKTLSWDCGWGNLCGAIKDQRRHY